MKIEEVKYHDVDSILTFCHKLVVPDYQRRFTWRYNEVSALYKDILDLEIDEHFLGSILLISYPETVDLYASHEIVDGQQRIVSIFLILKAIIKYYYDNKCVKYSTELNKTYLHTKRPGKTSIVKLSVNSRDKDSYESILRDQDGHNGNMFKAYSYFKDEIFKLSLDGVNKLLDRLLHKLKIVLIRTGTKGNAFVLFETLNDRGIVLTPMEKIKNNIFFRASLYDGDAYVSEINNIWSNIMDNLDNINETEFFRRYLLSEPDLSEILSDTIERRNLPINNNNLYKIFKTELKTKKDNLKPFLENIKELSAIYKHMFFHSFEQYDADQNKEINKSLENIRKIPATACYVLLLKSFKELNFQQMKELLWYIEILFIRRHICRWPTNELIKIFNTMCKEAFKKRKPVRYIKKYFQERIPSDEEFIESIQEHYFTKNRAKYFLGTLEEKHYDPGGKTVWWPDVTLEHILPVKPFSGTGKSYWEKYFSADESEDNYYKNYYTKIGNLTILETTANRPAGNKSFTDKKPYYDPATNTFNTRRSKVPTTMKITHELMAYTEWNITNLMSRNKKIAETASEIWKFV